MTGPIAQIVAITCHGNGFLQGIKVDGFFPGNSTFSFCDRVAFASLRKTVTGGMEETEIAGAPEEWFGMITTAGSRGLRLSRTRRNASSLSDRMTAGFTGGGGTWLIEVILPGNRSGFWIPRWELWNGDAPDRRIWRVTYTLVYEGVTEEHDTHHRHTIPRMKEALREIYSFSTEHNCKGFSQSFADALDSLESGGARLHGYHRDLAPAGCLPDQALGMLDACQRAWVFGGMGSWNDLGFRGDHQREYERVTEQLFESLCLAICDAANESCRIIAER